MQIDLDHEPWKSLTLQTPDGRKIFDVKNTGVLAGYGLTELFSESSEPPFTEFPLSEFQKLFPAGDYVLEGVQVDGTPMRSVVALTHHFPAGPEITSPDEDAKVNSRNLTIRWEAVTDPAGINIINYDVLVVTEEEPASVFSVRLPSSARSVTVSSEFLLPGDYKVEVLAIEESGNQTLSEVPFSVG